AFDALAKRLAVRGRRADRRRKGHAHRRVTLRPNIPPLENAGNRNHLRRHASHPKTRRNRRMARKLLALRPPLVALPTGRNRERSDRVPASGQCPSSSDRSGPCSLFTYLHASQMLVSLHKFCLLPFSAQGEWSCSQSFS